MSASSPDAHALAHALAGALGAVLSTGLLFPLEVLRTRLQVGDVSAASPNGSRVFFRSGSILKQLLRKEGVHALYKGFSAVLTTIGITNFVYFGIYRLQKQSPALASSVPASFIWNLIMAGLAGTVTVFVTTPMWLVNTRMKVQRTSTFELSDGNAGTCDKGHLGKAVPSIKPYSGLWDGFLRVGKEEGWTTLWDGTMPSLLLVSNPAIQWAVYEFLKDALRRWHGGADLAAMETFALAALAKTAATIATYPLQVAQTALRYNHGVHSATPSRSTCGEYQKVRAKKYAGTCDCLARLYRAGGVSNLFRGLESKMLQTVLTAAFHVVCYEKFVLSFLALARLARGP